MTQVAQQTLSPPEDARPKWLNSPVVHHSGTLSDMRSRIPIFERRAFGLTQPNGAMSRVNQRLDTIVRLPVHSDKAFVPVGVVSKNYALVQHTDVLTVAGLAVKAAGIDPDALKADMDLTEYGERMALSLYLPAGYNFDPGDGHPMALRLECLNSVDGSTRFRALLGWFRFVCRNGMVIGITRSDVRRRHLGDVGLEDVGKVLQAGLEESVAEQKNFGEWRGAKLKWDRFAAWVDEYLCKEWKFMAAAGRTISPAPDLTQRSPDNTKIRSRPPSK